MIKLGSKVKEKYSNKEGIVLGYCSYLHESDAVLVNFGDVSSEWITINRILILIVNEDSEKNN